MARVKQTMRAAEPANTEEAKKTRAKTADAEKKTRAKKADAEVVEKKTRAGVVEAVKRTRAKKADAEAAKPAKPAEKTKAASAEKPKSKKPASGGIVRPHRWRPGTVAKRESKRLRKTMGTTLMLQRGPFRELVRAQLGENVAPMTAEGYRQMQSIVESHVMRVLEVARVLLESGKRSTLSAADVDRAIALTRSAQTFLHEH